MSYLLIEPLAGLCNRIRCLVSFSILGEILKKRIYVYWHKTPGFSDDKFTDLFEGDSRWEFVDRNTFDRLRATSYRLADSRLSLADVLQNKHPNLSVSSCGRLDYMMIPEERKLIPDFDDRYCAMLKSLKPVESIRARIEQLTRGFDGHTIGVHIRRGDALQSDAKQKYMMSSNDAFIKCMQEECTRDAQTQFFLATDCSETQKLFLSRFPGRVKYQVTKRFVESDIKREKAGQQDAMVDLYCLAKTHKIIGNNWSSFSTTAAELGPRRITCASITCASI
jgi:hypothetical protein